MRKKVRRFVPKNVNESIREAKKWRPLYQDCLQRARRMTSDELRSALVVAHRKELFAGELEALIFEAQTRKFWTEEGFWFKVRVA